MRLVEKVRRETIDLDGPNGNIFYLMGTAKAMCRSIRLSEDFSDKIIDEMMESDYVNALRVFDKYFSDFITLETSNKDLLYSGEGH